MHCWLFCSFDAVNSTKVESLHTECCWTFSYVCTWEVTSRACASPRIICRGTLSWCCDVWPRSPSNMDDASWGGRAARLWCVCLRAAANTASGGHFYCFSFHFSWHVKKKKKKKTPKLFLTGLFFLFFSAATFKCTVKTFLGSNSFCALFWWKGAKMSFSADENLSAGWTVYWSHWGDHLDSICRSFLTGSQHYCIYKTKAHCLLLINWIRSRLRHRPRSHREETGWQRVVWWKQMSLGERERKRLK